MLCSTVLSRLGHEVLCGDLGPGGRLDVGGSFRFHCPAKVSAVVNTKMQRSTSWDLTKLIFRVFQAQGAPRKSKILEDDSSLKENAGLLAQNEYEEDSSDEEVGPIATFSFIHGYEVEVQYFPLRAAFSANSGEGMWSSNVVPERESPRLLFAASA